MKTKEQKFIPCHIPQLPKDDLIKAAEDAVRINPVNRPRFPALDSNGPLTQVVRAVVAQPLAIAVMTTKYWGTNGVKLNVTFTEPTQPELQRKIVAYGNRWGQRANVEFRLIDTTNWQEGDVRISRKGGGYWSYLGTDIRSIPRSQQTMNLQGFSLNTSLAEYERVVVHEFGHTLGFPHEHMRKAIIARLDKEKTYAYFARNQGWDRDEVDAQVLTPLGEAHIMATPADQDSIMCYQLPGSITKDGKPIPGGPQANDNDLNFAAKIYPKAVVPTDPKRPFRIVIESESEIKVTTLESGGLLI